MSLYGDYDVNNIFAKIISGDISCYKIYEDANTLSFLDLFPQSYGHCLVISKKSQARNLLDIEADHLTNLILTTQKIAQVIAKELQPDGIKIAQFNGEAAGQTVFHLHMHIIPRYIASELGVHACKQADADTLRTLQNRLVSAIKLSV